MKLAFLRLAHQEIDLEYVPPEPADWELYGFELPSFEDTIRYYEMWRDHGVMPDAGGYNDQTSQWAHDMQLCEAIFSVKIAEVRAEIARRPPKGAQGNA